MTNPAPNAASADNPALLRGRPRVGARRGESPTVKGRVTDAELEALKAVIAETGRTQSELVRQGVQLVLVAHGMVASNEVGT
ncbi:hypothetical protein DC31_05905 [Microbacterium sp. CH12i]|uniref:hypothetical protein n=1 Tax=Microbacterium sp. CH12i TaxID=1479651 RepID=UPI000460F9D7|nr:hypothetical protein [Microbacterium sp. CH12i]KDA04625.1 hypothetical protein DC31_05905 [Microbacterium sp. CH12i]